MTSVLILDDHALVAETLAAALTNDDVTVTAMDVRSEDPLAVLAREPYDFCLLDLDWGHGAFTGVSLIRPIRDAGASCIVLTGTAHEPLYGYCLELGAAGIISKSVSFAELVATIERAIAGESPNSDSEKLRWMLEASSSREVQRARLAPFARLTAAEADVLCQLMAGRNVSEIAAERTVALSTVRTHVHQVLQKLRVQSQLAAVALAREAGWPARLSLDTEEAPTLSAVAPGPTA